MNALDTPPTCQPVAPLQLALPAVTTLPCKCCGNTARLEGYADSERDCYGLNPRRGRVSGLPVPYYRCAACDFAFTDAFDAFSAEDFRRHIYNAEYEQFDPRFASERPKKTAARVMELAPARHTRILDYGSGNGLTVQLLRDAGYTDVTGFDPFHGGDSQRQPPTPQGYDFVICVEVAEHTTRPLELFAELGALVAPHGVILVSTQDFAEVKGRWVDDWYVAPRNGHVSFYSQRTLSLLAASLQRQYFKLDKYRHLLAPVV
jgi:SAM-dependent methyltransferase